MTGGEDQAQEVVVEWIVDLGLQIGALERAADLDLTTELLHLSVMDAGSPHPVYRPVLGGAHEPGARVVRDA